MTKKGSINYVPLPKIYEHTDYTIKIPANWYVDKIDGRQTFFYGPKVGEKRIGFYVTALEKEGKTYLDAAQKVKSDQETKRNYKVLEKKDISEADFKANMRRSCWYEEELDIVLFVREIFTESKDKVFILSSSIPNSPDLEELDRVVVGIMNSFRFSIPV